MSSFRLQIFCWIIALIIQTSNANNETIFGNISRKMEIIYIALICVGGLCVISCIACIIHRKCGCIGNRTITKDRSYEKVISGRESIVNYVDENDGNEDVMNIQSPLKKIKNVSTKQIQIVDRNEYETEGNEGNLEPNEPTEPTDDGITTK